MSAPVIDVATLVGILGLLYLESWPAHVSEERLGPNTYTHALFADFHLAGQK